MAKINMVIRFRGFWALWLFAAALAYAATGGSISGTVLDQTGAVIAQADLVLVNTGQATSYRLVSNKQGLYSFPNLPVGLYELTISAEGFTTQRKMSLAVDTDSTLRVDTTLTVGAHTDAVIVTSDTGIQVETAATHLGEVVSGATDDFPPIEWKELHGPAGDPAWSCAYLDAVAKLCHHGGRHREPGSLGRSESR